MNNYHARHNTLKAALIYLVALLLLGLTFHSEAQMSSAATTQASN